MSTNLNINTITLTRATALVSVAQANYDAAGYPALVITQAYVLTNALHVGLNWWVRPAFWKPAAFGLPPNQPTLSRLTPAAHVAGQTAVTVAAADSTYATTIATALGAVVNDVLGCACCTGVAMLTGFVLSGTPDGSPQVGPFAFP